MSYPGEAFQQFQDAFFANQQQLEHMQPYTNGQYYQQPIQVHQVPYEQGPIYVDYMPSNMVYPDQSQGFYPDQPVVPVPQERVHHPQTQSMNFHQRGYGTGPPQHRQYRGTGRGRARGRGGHPNRSISRQKYQEFHERFQHEPLPADTPVETLRPQVEDYSVEEEKTYIDAVSAVAVNDTRSQRDDPQARGRGKHQAYHMRGGGQRGGYHHWQSDSRYYQGQRSEGQPCGRPSARADRGHGSARKGDNSRNQHQSSSLQALRYAHEPSDSNLHSQKTTPKSNHQDEDDTDQHQSSKEEAKNKPKGAKQIKFRDFHSSAKNNVTNRTPTKVKEKTYKRLNLQDGDLETQRGVLIEQLTAAEYECMVCCESVRQDAAVWSCCKCYHVFHLRCVKRWARSAAAVEGDKEGGIGGWRCPGCQNVSQQFPHHYTCFCGKTRDPDWNRFDTPHTCGEVCQKLRSAECTHPCTILCHPGPCPPCHASVTKSCDCGKTQQSVKCGQSAPKCVEVCQKLLNCGKHECSAVCHPGACRPCDIVIKQTCCCGKEQREVKCGTAESFLHFFSCEKPCGRNLQCENHSCDRLCHPGSCDTCPLVPSAVTHCPCGKHLLSDMGDTGQRTSCVDPVPTCDGVCGKKLKCGPKNDAHECSLLCHEGACPPCEDGVTPVTCRCGILERDFPCHEAVAFTSHAPFCCDKRCNRKRRCGRHRCPNVCCIDEDHPCDLICGGKLTCGLHRCQEPCHRGNCPTCWQVSFDELHCHCGAEVLYPPIACGTKPPPCNRPCNRRHDCDHPVRHPCHNERNCPPCTELTEKWCRGRHELRRNIPCHLSDISCGMPCGKDLPCKLHKCQQICHKGPCSTEGTTCQQACPKPRSECGHDCGAPCHGDSPCPRGPCQTKITIKCKCGNRSERALCQLGGNTDTQEYQKMATMMMAMKMAEVQSGQSIDITSLTNSDPSKKKTRQLECTKECAILERNKRLALALEIKNPDLQGKLGNPTYCLFLRDFTKQNMSFVTGVEKQLADLVLSAQKSKQPKRSHAFPPMNSAQRRLVHELAEVYGCQSQSYDVEPKKNVVVTAQKDRCWQPTVSLVNYVQRELHPKAPLPIPYGATETETTSSRVAPEITSKSTKVKMAPWGRSIAAPAKVAPEVVEPPRAPGMSWASQVKRSNPQSGESDKPKEPEIDYFEMTS